MTKRRYVKRRGDLSTFDQKVESEFLPVHNVMQIAKSVVPAKTKFSKKFKILLTDILSEFIHIVAVKLVDQRASAAAGRQTFTDEDVLHAMESLGICQYSTYLRLFMSDYREKVFHVLTNRQTAFATPALTAPSPTDSVPAITFT